jgi:hypothetical protein
MSCGISFKKFATNYFFWSKIWSLENENRHLVYLKVAKLRLFPDSYFKETLVSLIVSNYTSTAKMYVFIISSFQDRGFYLQHITAKWSILKDTHMQFAEPEFCFFELS